MKTVILKQIEFFFQSYYFESNKPMNKQILMNKHTPNYFGYDDPSGSTTTSSNGSGGK